MNKENTIRDDRATRFCNYNTSMPPVRREVCETD